MDAGSERPSFALRRLVNGYQITWAIHVAAVLGIADLVSGGPRSADDLAAATDTHPDSLYRLLRALASVGIFREAEGRLFALTPLGDGLRSDAPESLAGWAAFVGRPYFQQAWSALEHSVRTGESAFAHVHGTDCWTYRAEHPDEGARFDRAMTSFSRQVSASILSVFDFGRFETIVDVGGGNGGFLATILAKHPATRGVLFDRSHVVAGAASLLSEVGVEDRCQVVAGDFFETVPSEGDAYLLKSILHDWDDARCMTILRTCRQAMAAGIALLVVEREIGPPNEAPAAKFSDLTMLVDQDGRERTIGEYTALFEATGFRFTGFTPGAAGFGIYEGTAS